MPVVVIQFALERRDAVAIFRTELTDGEGKVVLVLVLDVLLRLRPAQARP